MLAAVFVIAALLTLNIATAADVESAVEPCVDRKLHKTKCGKLAENAHVSTVLVTEAATSTAQCYIILQMAAPVVSYDSLNNVCSEYQATLPRFRNYEELTFIMTKLGKIAGTNMLPLDYSETLYYIGNQRIVPDGNFIKSKKQLAHKFSRKLDDVVYCYYELLEKQYSRTFLTPCETMKFTRFLCVVMNATGNGNNSVSTNIRRKQPKLISTAITANKGSATTRQWWLPNSAILCNGTLYQYDANRGKLSIVAKEHLLPNAIEIDTRDYIYKGKRYDGSSESFIDSWVFKLVMASFCFVSVLLALWFVTTKALISLTVPIHQTTFQSETNEILTCYENHSGDYEIPLQQLYPYEEIVTADKAAQRYGNLAEIVREMHEWPFQNNLRMFR
uniref:Uncharacterized protein n=1 Tax=Syphacia muris TaxID=451379 RepID=A0A0N5AH60_9BILA